MKRLPFVLTVATTLCVGAATHEHVHNRRKHHHHGHRKHSLQHAARAPPLAHALAQEEPPSPPSSTQEAAAAPPPAAGRGEASIVAKMKTLENELAKKEEATAGFLLKGRIDVNGPLPVDFAERFAQSVAQATGCAPDEVRVIETEPVTGLLQTKVSIVQIVFEAPADVVKAVEAQVADPDSKLAVGPLHEFLVAKDDGPGDTSSAAVEEGGAGAAAEETPVQEKGIDVDTEMPYGELEPFGREDTAQELTESSIRESDEMVDQLERAEVAEEKRAVFRALTRLRGAAITSYDGVARAQTGNIDEYNKVHQWRKTHPLHHLADEESDISRWAFPDNADF